MNDLDVSSLPIRSHNQQTIEPFKAVLIGCVSIVLISGILILSRNFEWISQMAAIAGFVLFLGLFAFLLPTALKHNHRKKLAVFSKFAHRNNFTYSTHSPDEINWSEYETDSRLLATTKSHFRSVHPVRTMSLSGIYHSLNFSIQPVARIWSVDKKKGIIWLGIITIQLPYSFTESVIAIDKNRVKLNSSTLNYEILEDEDTWHRDSIHWRASAYDIYVGPNGISQSSAPFITKVLEDLYELNTPVIEINDSTLYIILDNGLDYTRDGILDIFKRIDVIANSFIKNNLQKE